jgi:hypothetical protein
VTEDRRARRARLEREQQESWDREVTQGAMWLERIFHMPKESDYVVGKATVLSVNEPTGRLRYQECRMEVRLEADGIEPVVQTLESVLRREYWPAVGDVLPARILTTDVVQTEILWDALKR